MPHFTHRYERKKNISLAIKAFALLPPEVMRKSVLVVAGGYDTNVSAALVHGIQLLLNKCFAQCCVFIGTVQVRENVEYMAELQVPPFACDPPF